MAKVLIIDDDELICEMLSLMVEDMGRFPFLQAHYRGRFQAASPTPST